MTVGAFPALVRDQVLGRSGGVCERCFAGRVEEIHHRTPRQAGGSRAAWIALASNAAGLCRSCHAWVERRRAAAVESGWLVPRGVAEQAGGNAVAPVVDVAGQRWMLTDDGSKICLGRD